MDLRFIDLCSVSVNGIAHVYCVDHVLEQMHEETKHHYEQQPSQEGNIVGIDSEICYTI